MAQGGCPLSGVLVETPGDGGLVDDASVQVQVAYGRDLAAAGNELRIDGVELIAALSLVPPFSDAGGVVSIGGTPVTVSDFDYEIPAQDPVVIRVKLAGLDPGLHAIEGRGFDLFSVPVAKTTSFELLADPMTLELDGVASAGGRATPVISGTRVGKSSLGESLASPPVALSGGAGSVRQGFVPAAQGTP
jgi:hypothetical protein